MVFLYDIYQQPVWALFGLLVLTLWTLVWEGLGLWHAAQHKQRNWFIAILVLNTLGLLPIVYLIWFRPRREEKGDAFDEFVERLKKKSETKKKKIVRKKK